MGWTSAADMRAKLAAGKKIKIPFSKTAASSTGSAGVHMSLWDSAGNSGLNGSNVTTMTSPGTSGRVCDNLAGSIFVADTGSETKHILSLSATCTNPVQLICYDRCMDAGPFSLSSVTTHDLTATPAISRYDFEDSHTQVWAELTTATTTTAPVVSINSFTNVSGSSGLAGAQTTLGVNSVRVMYPLASTSVTRGIRSVESFQVHTAASAGACNVVILRKLFEVTIPIAGMGVSSDTIFEQFLPERVYDDASLCWMLYSLGNNTPQVTGELVIGWG